MIEPDLTRLSPNFNSAAPTGRGVVIHATRSGIPGYALELQATINWFMNPSSQASSHWVIGRKGEKVRMVPDNRQAWHAGFHNATHWGIELEQGVESDGFTESQIDALVAVCAGYVLDFLIPVEHGMNGFVGHEETAQGQSVGKSDPGRLFPWDDFITRLAAAVQPPLPLPEQEGAGSMVIIGHPTNQRSFLVVGSNAYHIPDGPTWDDLRLLLYGTQPHKVRQETWDWLKANEIIGGLFD